MEDEMVFNDEPTESAERTPFSRALSEEEASRTYEVDAATKLCYRDVRWALGKHEELLAWGAGDVALCLPGGEGYEFRVRHISFDYQISPREETVLYDDALETVCMGPTETGRAIGASSGYADWHDDSDARVVPAVNAGAIDALGHAMGAEWWDDGDA